LFITITTLIHYKIGIGFFESIIIIIIPYTLIWSFVTKKNKKFIKYSVLKLPQQMNSMKNFMFLFLSLGVFNEVIERTDIFTIIQESFIALGENPIILFIALQLSALILACVGVHPLVTISLQGLFLEPFLQIINPMSIAVVMITATLAADASGTFNVPITMLSQYMKRNPYRLTLWNLIFSLLFGGAGVILAYLLL